MNSIEEMRQMVAKSDESYRAGDIAGAIALLEPLALQNVDYFRPYYNLGFFRWLRGEIVESLPLLERSVKLAPTFVEGFYLLAKAQITARRYNDGIASLETYSQRGGSDPKAMQWRARALWGLGRNAEAAELVNDYANALGWSTPKAKSLCFAEEPWFLSHIDTWWRLLSPIAGRVERALEIGNMEGMSAIWIVENLLKPNGRLEINDIVWRENLNFNLARSGVEPCVKRHLGDSGRILPKLDVASYDFVYVDGDHAMASVFRDCVNAAVIAAPGAYIVLDDYGKANEPTKAGIDHFLAIFGRYVEVIESGYQIYLRRGDNPVSIEPDMHAELLKRLTEEARSGLSHMAPTEVLGALRAGAAALV